MVSIFDELLIHNTFIRSVSLTFSGMFLLVSTGVSVERWTKFEKGVDKVKE